MELVWNVRVVIIVSMLVDHVLFLAIHPIDCVAYFVTTMNSPESNLKMDGEPSFEISLLFDDVASYFTLLLYLRLQVQNNSFTVYPLPKKTNSQKLLFISISCIYIIFCVHIDNYLYKLMLC